MKAITSYGGVKPTGSGAPVALDQDGEHCSIRPENTDLSCFRCYLSCLLFKSEPIFQINTWILKDFLRIYACSS